MTKMPTERWVIEIDKAQFEKLKQDERFWQLVALARAVNAHRFVHAALLRHQEEGDSLDWQRTQFNSFFFNCALLFEALRLIERLNKHYRDVPEFAPLRDILKNRSATELRKSNLAPLRNHLAFHFDEAEIGVQLAKSDMATRFAAGEGTDNLDVYYELADACTLGAFSGLRLDTPGVLEPEGTLGMQIGFATDVAVQFMNAAESFIAKIVKADGWELRQVQT